MILSCDKQLRVDPVVENILNKIDSSIPLVPITRLEDFVFNEDLLNIDKYVVCDFIETGWDWNMESTLILGKNTYSDSFAHLFWGEEWQKLHNFIRDRQPALYFKRELLSKDCKGNIKPIEYPALNPIPAPQSKEQFNNRLLQVSNIWGLSHEERKRIHGDIWHNAGRHNYVVCDNISNINLFLAKEENPNKWLTQNVPYYARYDIRTILEIGELSKISCSWAGAGRKCFRHTESNINSVMIMWEDGIEWSYPFIDNVNCIKCEEGEEIEKIIEALNNPYLHDIYLSSIATAEKYYLPNYIKYYLMPLINSL